jgi:hypothetical protein
MPKRDREAEWQEKKGTMDEERAIRDSLEHPFEKNPDRFLAILAEVQGNPELVKAAKNGGRNLPSVEEDVRSIERTSYQSPAPQHQIPAKYAQVVQRLDRFPFSEDESVLKQQMNIVEGALRTAMHDIIIKAVATNTKRAFKQYCTRIQKVAGGLAVTYNFGDADIVVSAKGSFFGDETICIRNTEEGLVSSVVIIDGEDASDVSDQFEIKVR